MGRLFLVPNTLGESTINRVIPSEVIDVIRSLRVFATENPKNTRRYLKKMINPFGLMTWYFWI